MGLDLSKLNNVRNSGSKRIAQCPACASQGRDLHSKNHLAIYPDGRYGCSVNRSDDHSKLIYTIAGTNGSGVESYETTVPQIELPESWPLDYLTKLIQDNKYWNGRGISDSTLKQWRGGIATVGKMRNRYVFPILNEAEDAIVGFSGRSILPEVQMKWKHLGKVSQWLWGGFNEIESSKRAILVESIGDALMLMENGVQDVICIFGVNISGAVIAKLIALNPTSIVISTNRDIKHTVGQEAADRIADMLGKFFDTERISIVFPPERGDCKDWGTATKTEIEEAFKK